MLASSGVYDGSLYADPTVDYKSKCVLFLGCFGSMHAQFAHEPMKLCLATPHHTRPRNFTQGDKVNFPSIENNSANACPDQIIFYGLHIQARTRLDIMRKTSNIVYVRH